MESVGRGAARWGILAVLSPIVNIYLLLPLGVLGVLAPLLAPLLAPNSPDSHERHT